MDRIEAAANSDQRNHTLWVGRRGAGKTHLVSLAHARTKNLIDAGVRLQTAWPPEDLFWVAGYDDLLREILLRLGEPEDSLPALGDELEAVLTASAAQSGPVVLFIENLDYVLHSIGDLGQQKLRRLLEDSGAVLLVATTTSLSHDLVDQAKPFYGFMTATELDPFGVDDASDMLVKLAQHEHDDGLADYLKSSEGRARIEAIEHLAGGQPRIWATLSSAMTIDGLRGLVDLLLTEFDSLTPYYQEQFARLSPQQARVVNKLITADRPLHVAAIAQSLDTDQRSVARTLGELGDRRWVAPTASPFVKTLDRRRTYYELAEPLARVAQQIKSARNSPIQLIVDFCKMWFGKDDLKNVNSVPEIYQRALNNPDDGALALAQKLRQVPTVGTPGAELLGTVDDAVAQLQQGDASAVMNLKSTLRTALETSLEFQDDGYAEEASVANLRFRIHDMASQLFGQYPHPSTPDWIQRAETLLQPHGDSQVHTLAQHRLTSWLAANWRFEEAERIAALLPEDHPDTLTSLSNIASAYFQAGRLEEAIALQIRVLEDRERTVGTADRETLTARNNLAASYTHAGRIDEATELQSAVLADRENLLGPLHPETITTRNNLALTHNAAGRIDEAISLQERVLAERIDVMGADHPRTLISRNNLASSYAAAGHSEKAIPVFERALEDFERIHGSEDPNTLTTRSNLAGALNDVGRIDEAIPLQERVLADFERTLGPEHPNTLMSRNNLASLLNFAGRIDEAIPLQERVLADFERTLGPEHPNTLAAQRNLASSLEHDENTRPIRPSTIN